MALVIGTGAAETLGGGGEDDLIAGLGGDDTLNGEGGNDTLDGGTGSDTLIGGSGNDLYVVDSAADAVGEGPDGGTDTVLAFATYTLAENSNTEKFQLAGNLVIDGTGTDAAGDVILGNMAANNLTGLGGDDRLVGSFGDDSLEGGEGNDTLSGGPGTDSLVGGAGDDLYIDVLARAGNNSSGTLSLPGAITEDVEGGNDTLQVRFNAQRMTFTFLDDSAFTMSRVSSVTNPIVGSWYATGVGESNSTIAITFLADGSYMLAEDGVADGAGQDGMERGTYEWNAETGSFSATTTVDTNGEWGLSHSTLVKLRIDGDSLTIQATDGNLSLERVTSNSSPLVGAWTASNSGESASTVVMTFLDDGTFLLAEDGNRNLDPSGKDGMERGTYTWNQATGAFSVTGIAANTNGAWGLSHLEAGVKVSTSHLPVSPFPVALADNVENLDLSHTGKMRLDGTGNDLGNLMTGNGGVNVLLGGLGDDALNGNGGNDTLEGGGGNDTLDGGAGLDSMAGGAGDDVYFVSQGTDVVTEKSGEGVDTIRSIVTRTLGNHQDNLVLIGAGTINGNGNTMHNVLDGNGAANRLDGKGGNDTLSGAQGNDTLLGGDGDDEIDGGTGSDSMVGGAGNDTYFVNGAGDAVTESADGGTDTVLSSVNRTLGANQENLTLTGSAVEGSGNGLGNVIDGNDEANLLKGEGGNDTINGHGGDDTIEGNSGNDSIDGGEGADTMYGGSGNDRYLVVFGDGDVVIEEDGDGTDTIVTDGPIDMAANVENLVWLNTGGGGGVCNGNDLANVMIVQSGAGTLTMDGKGGTDTVSFEGFGSDAFIDLENGNSTLVDTLTSMENATGGLGNDMLTGNDVANLLNGSTGADTMSGGYGGDIYVVDSLLDVVMENDNTEATLVLPGGGGGLAIGDITDTVRAAINYSLEGVAFVENIVLTGNALNGTGNELDNRIIGNSKNNTLDGLAGIDTLAGAAGNDTLVWGGTADVYNGGAGTDTIRFGAGNLATKNVVANLLSVEKWDLRGDGDNMLTVRQADVLAMSSTDTLTVLGDAGDRVNAAGFVAAGASGNFDRYTNGLAVLLVENDVQVVI